MIDRHSRGRGGFVSRGIIGMAYPALLPQGWGIMGDHGGPWGTSSRSLSSLESKPTKCSVSCFIMFHHVYSCVICGHLGRIFKGIAKLIATRSTGRYIRCWQASQSPCGILWSHGSWTVECSVRTQFQFPWSQKH